MPLDMQEKKPLLSWWTKEVSLMGIMNGFNSVS